MLEFFYNQGQQVRFDEYTDEELILAIGNDGTAYEYIVQRYREPLIGFVLKRYVKDRSAAEDIVQDVFISAYQSIHTFDSTRKWRPWLYKIAVNASLNYLRKPMPLDIYDFLNFLTTDSTAGTGIDDELRKQKVQRALDSLDEKTRHVINLFYCSDYSSEDVVKFSGLSMSEVRKALGKARVEFLLTYEL